jgi:hypothetical protein
MGALEWVVVTVRGYVEGSRWGGRTSEVSGSWDCGLEVAEDMVASVIECVAKDEDAGGTTLIRLEMSVP